MSRTSEADVPTIEMLTRFTPTDSAIEAMRTEYMPLIIQDVNDNEGFKAVHSARMVVKNHRVQVEKVRKDLKADALEYGRRVDAEAKRITAALEPIESHLAAEEDAYEAERERIKNAARLKAEAEAKAKADAEAAQLKAQHDAEVKQLRIERQELDAQRAAMEAEWKAAQDKLDAERRAVEAEKQRLADIEAARLWEVETKRREAEAAERSKIETEQRIAREAAAEKAKAEAAEAARIKAAALRPDREKLLSVAFALNAINIPEVTDDANDAAIQVRIVLSDAEQKIRRIVENLT